MALLCAPGTGDGVDFGAGVPKAATFSAFIRFKAAALDDTGRYLLRMVSSAGPLDWNLWLGPTANSVYATSAEFGNLYAAGFSAGSIHTIVITHDGSWVRVYVDNDATPKFLAGVSAPPPQDAGEHLLIGDPGTSSPASTIYEVGYWPDVVLSGFEAAQMFSGTPPFTQPPHYWPLLSDANALFGGQNGTVTGATFVAHSGTNLYAGSGSGGGAITEVGSGSQKATIRASTVDSATVAYPANVTAGNLLVCVGALWVSGAGAGSVTVTDTLGTSYTVLLGSGTGYSAGFGQPFIAYGIAPSSGACTVTVNPTGASAYINAAIDEFYGVHPTPLDVDGGQSTGTFATPPSDSLTTLTDGALVLGILVTEGPVINHPGSGYTELDADQSGARQPYSAVWKIASPAGSQTVNWTLDTSTQWAVSTAAFKAAGTSTGTSTPKAVADTLGLTEGLTSGASGPASGVVVVTIGHGIELHSSAAIPSVFSFWPDSGIGIINNGDGTFGFYAGAGGGGSGPETLDGDYNYGNGMIWRGNGTVDNLFASINRPTITSFALNPDGGPSNVQWKGGGPVYKDPGTGLLIMIWHNEEALGGGSYWSWLSLARSVNGGATWQECGAIITPHHSHAEMAAAMISQGYGGPNYIANDGWGQFIVHGGFIYVYFALNDDPITATGIRGYGWGVARATLADVIAAAAAGTVSTWNKYNAGWSEPGLYGTGVRIFPGDADPFFWGPALAYSTYRNKFMLMAYRQSTAGTLTFLYKESDDGIVWTDAQLIANVDGISISTTFDPYKYLTIAPTSGDQWAVGPSFYLLGHKFDDDSIWRFPVTLTGTTSPPSEPSADAGSAAFRGVGRGLFRGLG